MTSKGYVGDKPSFSYHLHRGHLYQTNILISDVGNALITDFGLSSVLEEFSLTESRLLAAKLGTSVLAGSTRWMAPELILTLVEDDGMVPPITTASDVYSFACVCLEVCIWLLTGCALIAYPDHFSGGDWPVAIRSPSG